eukprot:SAG31_NODE_334_length_17513_cov_10.799989_2_plen_429_part_00
MALGPLLHPLTSQGLVDSIVRIDGMLVAEFSTTLWPGCPDACAPFLQISGASNLTVTSSLKWPQPFPAVPTTPLTDLSTPIHPLRGGGAIDGQGAKWWDWKLLTGKKCPNPLLKIDGSTGVLLEQLQLVNSPSFHVGLSGSRNVEVRYMDIYVDRAAQRKIRSSAVPATVSGSKLSPYPPQNPAWLNTDGIDPSGENFWIHHCAIVNDDDSIAVKPLSAKKQPGLTCSENMRIEHIVATGVGASIGSVPPHEDHNCVRNITFFNFTMPGTTKGIYVKSNPSCGPGKTAEITNVLYQNFRILSPKWWAVWIGPQQQHEPKSALGEKCALDWPITPHCPTQGCVSFTNVTLRDVYIEEPALGSPGVIMGNETNPMVGVVFDNVVVRYTDGKSHPIDPEKPLLRSNTYHCESANGVATDDEPPPACLLHQA